MKSTTFKFALLLLCLIGLSCNVKAWWNCNWAYRIPITIQENSGTTLTDYQVNFTIDTASLIAQGKMRPDCGDIRFTYYDSVNNTEVEIPYWIESGCNTTSTKIWVKVPYIPANGKVTVYMYYGNPSATSESNPHKVFYFYEDWESGTINTSIWTNSGWSITGVGAYQGLYALYTYTFASLLNPPSISTTVNCTFTCRVDFYLEVSGGTWSGVTFQVDTTSFSYSNLPSWTYETVTNIAPGSHTLSWTAYAFISSLTADLDYIIVRGYASIEPSVTIGSEENKWEILNIVLVQPANGSTIYTDLPTIKADIITRCPVPISANLNIYYPSNITYSMSCIGSTCSKTVDLNTIGLQPDGIVWYNITASTAADSVTSANFTFNVPTNHFVTISSPLNNTVVTISENNPYLVIKASSNSILDIVNCTATISMPGYTPFNITGTKTSDTSCEFYLDMSKYCVNSVSFNVSMKNSANVANVSATFYVTINYAQPTVTFISPTPLNGTYLSLRYLPVGVEVSQTNTCILNVRYPNNTVLNFTMNCNQGKCYYELYHPNLGVGWHIINVTAFGICGLKTTTENRYINVPPLIYKVNLVSPPTPSNGSSLEYRFLEVQGKVYDNALTYTTCELEVWNGTAWNTVLKNMQSCYGYIYNQQLNNSIYNGNVTYRIKIVDSRWGLSNVSEIRYVKVPSGIPNVAVIPTGIDSKTAQTIVDNAISNNIPVVVFTQGIHKINLVINSKGRPLRLVGALATLQPEIKGYPVIKIVSSNITLERTAINNALFAIWIENANNISIDKIRVYDSLIGIKAVNSTVKVNNSYLYGKLAGVWFENSNKGQVLNTESEGKVWGIYIKDTNNVTVDNSKVSAKVFGITIEGNNNSIKNTKINGEVYGLWVSTGTNNTIENVAVTSKVFAMRIAPKNIVHNSTIEYTKVFGLYLDGESDVYNVTVKYSKLFGAYVSGNVSNLTINSAKFMIKTEGSGKISYLKMGNVLSNITFSGSMIITYKNDMNVAIPGWVYTGWNIYLLGQGYLSADFLHSGFTKYAVYKILGKIPSDEPISNSTSFIANDFGIYALYGR